MTKRFLRVTDLCALASAVLFFLGMGLRPVPLLTWVALAPLFWMAPRVPARRAAVLSVLAGVLGQAGLGYYFATVIEMLASLLAVLLLYVGALVAAVVLLTRFLLRRDRPLLALVAAPSAWVVGEYLLTLLTPHGAWWSLGYSQAGLVPVLQVASLAGVWGISFLLVLASAALGVLFAPGARGRRQVGVALLLVVLSLGGYATWHLRDTQPRNLTVAVAVAAQPSYEVPVTSAPGRRVLAGYTSLVAALADRGAQVVVLPEKGLRADRVGLADVTGPLSAVASAHHVDVVVGVLFDTRPGSAENLAIALPGRGGTPATYRKQHLIPGLESDIAPGSRLALGPNRYEGLVVCKDLDFPALARDYRRHGATVLLTPAWDFDSDGWLHSRIAVTRGVENGQSIVRSGRDGELTISDPAGRVRAEHGARAGVESSIVATVPTDAPGTLYTRLGDWLPYLALLVLAFSVVLARSGSSSRTGHEGHSRPRTTSPSVPG